MNGRSDIPLDRPPIRTPGMGGSQGVEVPPGPGRRDRSEPQGVGP